MQNAEKLYRQMRVVTAMYEIYYSMVFFNAVVPRTFDVCCFVIVTVMVPMVILLILFFYLC